MFSFHSSTIEVRHEKALAASVVVGCTAASAVGQAACAGDSVCGVAGCSGSTDSVSSLEGLWLPLSTRLHPLMLPVVPLLALPNCVATPLSAGFLVFLSGIYLIHVIAFGYSKFRLYRPIKYDTSCPGVSIMKPLVGTDANLEQNLESFFNIKYHEYELLFCVHERTDSALPIVKRLMDKYPAVQATIFYGGEQVGLNPKINNMMPAYRASKYPLVLISDCGIRMQPDGLQDMVNSMTPKVALVTQTPFCMDRPGFGASVEQIYFGTGHARIYLAGNCMQFVCSTGMSCLMRKSALEECGGLEEFGKYLAEDYFFGVALVAKGWKCAIGSLPAMQNPADVTVDKFTARICRWMKLRVAMLPHTIILEPIQDCFLSGILGSLAAKHLFGVNPLLYITLHLTFWFTMDYMLINVIQNGPLPYTLADFARAWVYRETSAFPTYLKALFNPEIQWRRGVYRLRWGGTITKVR